MIYRIYLILFFFSLSSCKKNIKESSTLDNKTTILLKEKDSSKGSNIDIVKIKDTIIPNVYNKIISNEIYIGKKFYEQDELNDFLYKEGGSISKDSMIVYTIYENENKIIYSVEKQISYEDLREYIILDTINYKKLNFKKISAKKNPLNKNIILEIWSNSETLKVYKFNFEKNKIIKPH